tara:strand:+ start:54184 stop:55026 length:843 start_codon:yes stop_codon:yes gene_type:complete
MSALIIKSNSKVNIGLNILNHRPDGYHNINTVFQEIDFHDTLIVEKQKSGFSFSCNVDWLSNSNNNLCFQAWKKLKRLYDFGGVSIKLEKNIPPGKGLGGGSSNAASVLKALVKLYKLKISRKKLEQIGSGIGADIPFFINGGTQIGKGIGEVLKPLNVHIPGRYLLVMPKIFIDTSWAFRKFKKILDKPRDTINFTDFLKNGNIHFELFENDFESIVVPAYPEIGVIKNKLRDLGAVYASLSGSGSTVFGIFDEDATAKVAESHFLSKYKIFLSNPIKS